MIDCASLPEYACKSVVSGCLWLELFGTEGCHDTMSYKVIDAYVIEELESEEMCNLVAPCGTWEGGFCVENSEWADDRCVFPAWRDVSARETNDYSFMCAIYEDKETCVDVFNDVNKLKGCRWNGSACEADWEYLYVTDTAAYCGGFVDASSC
jgi:hypothetical protein